MTQKRVKVKTINNQELIGSGNISVSTFDGNYNNLTNKPSIPTKTSDLQNDGSSSSDSLVYVETSATSGLLKNDGSVDTTSYSTFSGSYDDLSNKPSIPSKTSDLTNDGDDGTNVFVKTNDARLYDTGWQDMVFPTGFGHYSTNQNAQYRRIGKIVHLRGAVRNTNAFTSSSDTSNHIATISDTTCRPSDQNELSIQQGSGQNRFLLTIDPNGKLYCARYGTTSNTQVNASAWLNINCTFMVG